MSGTTVSFTTVYNGNTASTQGQTGIFIDSTVPVVSFSITVPANGLSVGDSVSYTETTSSSVITGTGTYQGSVSGQPVLSIGSSYQNLYLLDQDFPFSVSTFESIQNSNYDAPTCYATGTKIATPDGERAVEDLVVGDLVLTAAGPARPIRWIGHRTLDCRNHNTPSQAHPIRIAAHAFGHNRPAQELLVSPAHAICVDLLGEILIPACALVNGATIIQLDVDQITYWHVELDTHDILLANNLPAESYLDMGNRAFFVEHDLVDMTLPPDADPARRTTADFCRPFVTEGPLLEAARLQLRRRAEMLGWSIDASDPWADLHLEIDGRRIDPVTRGLTARFAIPAEPGDAWIVCHTSRPRDVDGADDGRDLGLCLTRLAIDNGFERTDIRLDDLLLTDGFYNLEDSCRRWTNGRARLPEALWQREAGVCFLLIDVAGPALSRWVQATDVGSTSLAKAG